MIILMPENRKGLSVLEDYLSDNLADTTKSYENIFDQVTHTVELSRRRVRHSVDVEMPVFTIKSDIPVMEHMQAVIKHYIYPII